MCDDLPHPANGLVSLSGNATGDTTNYTCDAGYELEGASVRTCQTDGQWSGTAPTCTLRKTSRLLSFNPQCACAGNPACVCVCVSLCLELFQRPFTPATNDTHGFLLGFFWI